MHGKNPNDAAIVDAKVDALRFDHQSGRKAQNFIAEHILKVISNNARITGSGKAEYHKRREKTRNEEL